MPASCRTSALRFLKIRPRSEHELRDKLKQKGFDPADIDAAVEWLLSIDMLNDRAFTVAWINYRLARPFGFSRIIRELKEKGIAPALIDELVAEAKAQYAEGDTVLELARRRAERLKGIDPLKRKKRVLDYLIRRGFSIGEAMKAIKKI